MARLDPVDVVVVGPRWALVVCRRDLLPRWRLERTGVSAPEADLASAAPVVLLRVVRPQPGFRGKQPGTKDALPLVHSIFLTAPTITATERDWKRRYRAARLSLPTWARDNPDRLVYTSNASGKYEVYAWDRATDEHRQVTDRPAGTGYMVPPSLDPAGKRIYWFDDAKGNDYITRGRGVTVHRADCSNVKGSADKERFVEVEWERSTTRTYPVAIRI